MKKDTNELQKLWGKFFSSGKIDDYLEYSKAKEKRHS